MRIDEILSRLGVEFRRHGESKHVREGWVGTICPFCDRGQGNYGLGLDISTGGCSCWRCGRRGLVEALIALSGASYGTVKDLLGGFHKEVVKEAPPGRLQIPEGVGPMRKQHRQYLESRGFDPDEIAEVWGVQGIPWVPDGLSWRLFIPIHLNGNIVSWTTRSIAPEASLRYVAAKTTQEALSRRKLLYGARRGLAGHACVVTEGPTDAWAIGPGAFATMGLAYSPHQMGIISTFLIKVIVFDNEVEAQKRARKLCKLLEVLPGEVYQVTLSGSDPASSPKEEIRELRRRFLE